MENLVSFGDYTIVACGALNMELNCLKDSRCAYQDWDKVMENEPEKILEFSDWIGTPIEPHRISLMDPIKPGK